MEKNFTNIERALAFLDVSALNYNEWLNVGMALKTEGLDVSVWDEWSRNDSRYHDGVCLEKWNSFKRDGDKGRTVTGGTIIQLAKSRGWKPETRGNTPLSWNSEIEYDGDDRISGQAGSSVPPENDRGFQATDTEHSTNSSIGQKANSEPYKRPETRYATDSEHSTNSSIGQKPPIEPYKMLESYLEILYEPGDLVRYVTGDVWKNKNGKLCPGNGCYDRTAGELLATLKKHAGPESIAMTFGDWNPEVGAWIQLNPLDGRGIKSENVTRFRWALVESDSMPLEQQEAALRALQLPIACLVYSGGKSLHGVVHVDASNEAEFTERVNYLYAFLQKHGFPVDTQNKNCNRLSRMPGVTRNGKLQRLIDTNIGMADWASWHAYALELEEDEADDLPPIVPIRAYRDNRPALPEELIEGILRRGHKMILTGASKAGKSFLLMELAICIAEGLKWMGHQCRRGRVLYINLEIDPASSIDRVFRIYQAMGVPMQHDDDIELWNLRGHALPLNELVPKLIRRTRDRHFDAIMLDPIYKVITGDENSATDMGAFCNQFDKICEVTGSAAIYCHHHSKGAQGAKKAMDRGSGSGVFARDPDALLDVVQLELTDDLKNNVADGNATAWRMESTLREFAPIRPVNFWFEYPVHRVDTSGELALVGAEGSFEAVRARNRKCTTKDERMRSIDSAYDACSFNMPVTIAAMAEYLEVSEHCVRERLRSRKAEYAYDRGIVRRMDLTEADEAEI